MQTFFLTTGLAVSIVGVMMGDVLTIALATIAICLACLIPDGV